MFNSNFFEAWDELNEVADETKQELTWCTNKMLEKARTMAIPYDELNAFICGFDANKKDDKNVKDYLDCLYTISNNVSLKNHTDAFGNTLAHFLIAHYSELGIKNYFNNPDKNLECTFADNTHSTFHRGIGENNADLVISCTLKDGNKKDLLIDVKTPDKVEASDLKNYTANGHTTQMLAVVGCNDSKTAYITVPAIEQYLDLWTVLVGEDAITDTLREHKLNEFLITGPDSKDWADWCTLVKEKCAEIQNSYTLSKEAHFYTKTNANSANRNDESAIEDIKLIKSKYSEWYNNWADNNSFGPKSDRAIVAFFKDLVGLTDDTKKSTAADIQLLSKISGVCKVAIYNFDASNLRNNLKHNTKYLYDYAVSAFRQDILNRQID